MSLRLKGGEGLYFLAVTQHLRFTLSLQSQNSSSHNNIDFGSQSNIPTSAAKYSMMQLTDK